jgi:hypothetical protein
VTLATGLSNNFVFSNPIHDLNHDINVSFTGDELYYKFYANISDIEINAYDSSNTSDPSVQLVNKGFFPLCLSTDSAPYNRTDPVIAISSSVAQSGSTVTVTLLAGPPPITPLSTFVVTNGGPTGEIRRNIPDVAPRLNFYKTFLDGLANGSVNYVIGSGGDADVVNMPSGPTVVYVAMYAMSFGYTAASTPERSVPTYLGYVPINPFP